MKEIFKDIEGYEGVYSISNYGRIKRIKSNKIRKLKKDKGGYLEVGLCTGGKVKFYLVHRLVASAFIPNPDNLTEINHKDEDKTNNNVTNLEWCDRCYNINYGTAIQRRVENTDYKAIAAKIDYKAIAAKIAAKRSKQVLCVETGKIYPSVIEVQRQLGFNNSNIVNVCNGKLKTCGGFHWQYVI